jgi:hypothetical protein
MFWASVTGMMRNSPGAAVLTQVLPSEFLYQKSLTWRSGEMASPEAALPRKMPRISVSVGSETVYPGMLTTMTAIFCGPVVEQTALAASTSVVELATMVSPDLTPAAASVSLHLRSPERRPAGIRLAGRPVAPWRR